MSLVAARWALAGEIAWLVVSTALLVAVIVRAPSQFWTAVTLTMLVANTVRCGFQIREAGRRLAVLCAGA